ncbi:MAG: sigma-70 family RNA polymerase sigma factor [Gemmataceae bacterium]|nr:sigma-70 family RNA polymerase sigma factor [Gemmata sp.]MDW8198899.1 sigma-70 family RNA polymerase sigma factor [Gemmataceae bacterium]
MAEPPVTRVTLLARIKDGRDTDAWREFVQLYGPVVYRFARNRGLQDADAADLMQDVLRSVARNAHRMDYDPQRGTFRGWLYTVTRNKIYNFLSSQRNRPRGSGDTDAHERLDATPARDDDGPDADWEKEYQRELSARAMEIVKGEFQPSTWAAFWQTAVEGKAAADVGAQLKMSPGAVYVAKSRVLARLRDEVQKMMAAEE